MSRWKYPVFCVILACASVSPRGIAAQWTQIAAGLIENPVGTNCAMTYQNGLLWIGSKTFRVSTDLGKTFTLISNPTQSFISHIDFPDRQHGLVADNTSAFTTSDGGISWTPVFTGTSGELWCCAVLGNTNNLLIGEGYPGTVHVSHDGGMNWSNNTLGDFPCNVVYKPLSSTTYLFAGDQAQGAHIWVSHDRGATWEERLGAVDFDSWSFQVTGCDEKNIFVSNEDFAVPTDNISQIFVSSDGGDSWTKPIGFPGTFFCGSVAISDHAIYCPSLDQGVFRSTDKGMHWRSIGGPNRDADSRMISAIDDNLLFATDAQGTLFKTTNSGGDSLSIKGSGASDVLWLPTAPPVLDQAECPASDSTIEFGFASCEHSATLLSVTLLDSMGNIPTNVTIINAASLPRSINTTDGIHLRFYARSGSKETVKLKMHYSIASVIHDTTITFVLRNAIDYSATTVSDGTFTPQPNVDVSLPIKAKLPASAAHLANITDIEYSLAFQSDMLDIAPSQLLGRITPPMGWSVTSAGISSNHLQVSLHNVSTASFTTPLDLGSVRFATSISPQKSTLVTMTGLTLKTANESKFFCFTTEGDYIASVAVVGSSVAAVTEPVILLSIYPNPSSSGVFNIEYTLPAALQVGWSVVDILGRTVKVSEQEERAGGQQTLQLSLGDIVNGSYFIRFTIGTTILTRPIVIDR
jgi:photosystem II stability/assembly factor-like uncharacterized protein